MEEVSLQHDHEPLRFLFLPFLTPGHMIPMLDLALLFSSHSFNISATVLTTPSNAPLVRPTIDRFNAANPAANPVELALVPFPAEVAHHLPTAGGALVENLSLISSSHHASFFHAFLALQHPFDSFIRARRPNCIVSDSMFLWSADTALALDIPRLVFYGPGIFVHCVHEKIEAAELASTSSTSTSIIEGLGLPYDLKLKRSEISPQIVSNPALLKMLRDGEDKSYGVIVNSFAELEPEYAEIYRAMRHGRRAYYVGPVSLCNKNDVNRGGGGDEDQATRCAALKWLDSKREGSVIYVSFGTLNEFSVEQLKEIAAGLERSDKSYVWAMKKNKETVDQEGHLIDDDGDEERRKGILIRGWAPQVAMLKHRAVGGFLTHCGWNSTLESVCAGVPMATWPVEYDQFVNEKLVVDVLGIGVGVKRGEEGVAVKAEEVARAVQDLMGDGEAAEERRARVRKYAALAKAAVEEGGSSYSDIGRLIDEVQRLRDHRS